ncbi:nucleotidyl transferase AbiEii/AbiGii toxin family protein [Actinoplanes sp. RD1]|uniref:nucleotidyl transferase AbiEii/AbiGii toxin family protein n=1 Tax=Actinoplanes sp. RD1 TaxID=3064538 RepID=UPI002742752E|nr:nucleotidyl transferase AbiEii/AbiGii toxin family protein [Actinoplanes sp. RD1]
MKDVHERIARIALDAGGRYGFALAGGYAVSAHGIGDRPSGDVDIFTDWDARADFPSAVTAVEDALDYYGFVVYEAKRSDTFARLLLTDGNGAPPEKLEMSADWRVHPPVQLEIGPVLHPDDAVANKMAALYGRAAPRDFLDVDAVLESGRYTRERLLELAEAADTGFDRGYFAEALGALAHIPDAQFGMYGIAAEALPAMRERFAQWRSELSNG